MQVLRIIAIVSWYVTNDTLHRDFKIPSIKETIRKFYQRYRERLEEHPTNLMKKRGIVRRLKKKRSTDLS